MRQKITIKYDVARELWEFVLCLEVSRCLGDV